jgi:hypothetical protein
MFKRTSLQGFRILKTIKNISFNRVKPGGGKNEAGKTVPHEALWLYSGKKNPTAANGERVSPGKPAPRLPKGIIVFIIIPAFLFFSRALKERALAEAPIITSATYQHTQYNGRGQAVEVVSARDDAPPFVVTYFRSEEDLEQDRNGFVEAPLDVGDYYVRIERPEGNGYRRGNNIKIEYHIQKAFIAIIAGPVQRFAWDGRPKEIAARTEPPEEPPLIVSYFTAGPGGTALAAPPSERGRYRAGIVFPGNHRYMGASKEVEMRIE